MSYCKQCGKQLSEQDKFCNSCGAPNDNSDIYSNAPRQPQTQPQRNYQYQPTVSFQPIAYVAPSPGSLIAQLSKKIKTEAIVWTIIASLQTVAGLYNIWYGIDWEEGANITSGIFLLLVAGLNFFTCGKDFAYAKSVFSNPTGIIKKYKPIGTYIFNALYNLLLGGVIGIVGTIFCFVTRKLVVDNEQSFAEIENSCTSTANG